MIFISVAAPATAGRHGRRPHRLPRRGCPRRGRPRQGGPGTMTQMRLRTRLNLGLAALSGVFMIVLIAAEIQSTRNSVREEIEAANRVAAQLLGRLAGVYSNVGGPDLVLGFLQQLGHVRANEVYLLSSSGKEIYRLPPATYKAGREAPGWFVKLLTPPIAKV